jgi:hypothetical protein
MPARRQPARGSDEAAIFPGELAIWVVRASLISQPSRGFGNGADLGVDFALVQGLEDLLQV